MNLLLYLILLGSCALVLAKHKVIWEPHDEIYLRTQEVLRTTERFKPSYRYKFQDPYFRTLQGSNVYIFGLQTARAAMIKFHDSSGTQPDILFTLNKEVADEEDEWECSVEYMDRRNPSTFTIPCYLDLYSDSWLWFTILTKKGYLAIYENGIDTPVIDLTRKDVGVKKINFNKYDSYTVSSQSQARWDFQGHTLKNEDLYDAYLDKRLTKALKRVRKNCLVVQKQSWKCYHALYAKKKEKDKTLKFKYVKFMQKHCFMADFQPYADSLTRQRSILRVNGAKLPDKSEYDVLKFFKEVYSP